MKPTSPGRLRQRGHLLPLAALLPAILLLASPAARAQSSTQPISPAVGLPSVTGTFNHTQVVSVAGTPYNFNYYDFNITGFTNVGSGSTNGISNHDYYAIFSFSNGTLEKTPGVVGVAPAYLPQGWTFDDSHDFTISTSSLIGIYPDDPQFGLIFIQAVGTRPLDPTGAPFEVYHQTGGSDPFTLNGAPVMVLVNAPVPEASTGASLGLLLLGGVAVAARRKRRARKAPAA